MLEHIGGNTAPVDTAIAIIGMWELFQNRCHGLTMF
jgi:hypothetical protein